MTSRTPILDQCLAIRNLLALSDHELEEIINLQQEELEGLHLPNLTEEEYKDLKDSYTSEISATLLSYRDNYNLRKELQMALFKQYNIDMKYWCQFKHKLTIQEALKEVADATNDQEDWSRFDTFTQSLYVRIGKITGLWHTPCGRCLLDATLDPKNKSDDKKENKPSETSEAVW